MLPNAQPDDTNAGKMEPHINGLAAVGQIAAGIAHEVRNPLTAVKGFLQLLQKQFPHEYLHIAQTELDNAILTLQNLLQVAKPDMDNEPVQEMKLCDELESILHLFQDQLYRVRVETHMIDTGRTIQGKKNQIKKAFFNILKNAFEAIPGEGVITINHYEEGEYLVVVMKDTGTGIPEDKLHLIGTPFFSTKQEGTGMGLTQVFAVFYQHGCRIDVESEEGKGTAFRIAFPICKQLQSQDPAEMALRFEEGQTFKEFFQANRMEFDKRLLAEAAAVSRMEQTGQQSIDFLLKNTHKLIDLLLEQKGCELILLAKEEGRLWAQYSLTLAMKLEWHRTLRKTLWDFLYYYEKVKSTKGTFDDFFALERSVNMSMDKFLNHFYIAFSQSRNPLPEPEQEVIEDLQTFYFTNSANVCAVPLKGSIDSYRAKNVQDKVFQLIGSNHAEHMILDLSEAAILHIDVVTQLLNMIEGIRVMGCRPIITGIRPEAASLIIQSGISFSEKVETKVSLEQALREYGFQEQS